MAKQICDYNKYGLNDYEYYGFHKRRGRFSIDTARIKKLGYKDAFPIGLFTSPRNTHYFIPKYKRKFDYACNELLETLNKLSENWNEEYIPAIQSIKTPEEVYMNVRSDELSFLSSSDDYDDVEVSARMASFKRMKVYVEIIESICLQYLQRIFIEFFRTILLVIKKRGYEDKEDFGFNKFLRYVNKTTNRKGDKANPIYQLPHYKDFSSLNLIVNFLKHNTVRSYLNLYNNPEEKDQSLKQFYSSFVYSEEELKEQYENGMYAGDWLKLDPNFIPYILNNLKEFSKELCKLLYDEDACEAEWNSDEALLKILNDKLIDIF